MDVFISHSSKDQTIATRLARALEASGITVLLDDSEIRVGALLGKKHQDSIAASRALVLLWSLPASHSRWVNTEWLSAFHQKRFIVPCVLDDTPLPLCLQSSVVLDLSRVDTATGKRLARSIRGAPSSANPVAPVMRSESPELKLAIDAIVKGQQTLTDQLLRRELDRAAGVQSRLDSVMRKCAKWRLDPVISNLGGYHIKNAYLLRHWDAIQAGRAPQDPLLAQAERKFFETLCIDPTDPSALNGLGSILIFQRELEAAEFFIRAAIGAAEKRRMAFPAARPDLAIVERHKKPG